MDNIFVERLWRSIKYEEVYLNAYLDGPEAKAGIGAYLRLRLSLSFLQPRRGPANPIFMSGLLVGQLQFAN